MKNPVACRLHYADSSIHVKSVPSWTKCPALRFRFEWTNQPNVVITQDIAQGVSNIGPGLDCVRKQYWDKMVQNFATRGLLSSLLRNWRPIYS